MNYPCYYNWTMVFLHFYFHRRGLDAGSSLYLGANIAGASDERVNCGFLQQLNNI